MDPREITGLAGLGVLLLLILLRIPVVVAMIAVGLGGSYALSVVAPSCGSSPICGSSSRCCGKAWRAMT